MGSIKGSFLPGASQKDESRRESCREGGLAGCKRGREAGKASTIKVSAGVRPLRPVSDGVPTNEKLGERVDPKEPWRQQDKQ